MNKIMRARGLRFQIFTDVPDADWFVFPAVIISSDDWRMEAALEFRWLRWRLCFQWWIN